MTNPFMRGYYDFTIERLTLINADDHTPPFHRSIHPSQRHLSDGQLNQHTCIFNNDFMLVTKGHPIAADIDALCNGQGIVQQVLYRMSGQNRYSSVHLGDVYSWDYASTIIQSLNFENGFYNRCWEISTAHLPSHAFDYLYSLADQFSPSKLLFEAFRIPCSPAIGIKLIGTPWSDVNLFETVNIRYEQLQQEQHQHGVPEAVVNLLHQAAMADVRFLVLDADAPMLEGLALYDED